MSEITVATPRQEIVRHRECTQVVRDLMGGQRVMREAGSRYIYQYQDEDQAKWKERVASCTLFNAYDRTQAYLAGQVFSKPVTLAEDGKAVDPVWEEWAENVDGKGNNLTVFGKRNFGHGINAGFALILVDSSAVQTRETATGREFFDEEKKDWFPLTVTEADRLGLRPRMIDVRAENVLGWRFEITGSRTRLTLIRLLETYTDPAEWDAGDVVRAQVRVLRPGAWEVWRKQKEEDDKTWFKFQEGTLPGLEIPVAIFRPGKAHDDEMTAEPALQALADKNVEHWQKTAEHNWLMQWVRSPGMYVTGVQPEDAVPWGPGVLTKVPMENGRIESVGVDAASVTASIAELKDIETQMALFGLQLLMPRTGDVTATDKALSAAESDSTLTGWAGEYKDALEQALVFVAEFMGMDGEAAPSVQVNTEFHALAAFDDQTLNALIMAATNGKLPVEVLWSEMRRRGIISEEWTPEKITETLRKQNLDGTFQEPASKFLRVQGNGPAPNASGSTGTNESQADQPQNAA